METVAVVQARMGSSRLPGKMMLPLSGRHAIERVILRTAAARTVDRMIVAISDGQADDILERYSRRAGVETFRGDEADVLGRVYGAVAPIEPDVVVRMCGDRPLIPPAVVDGVVTALAEEGAEYASNTIERTFPWGWGCEAFTIESFGEVERRAESAYDREHVTPYYREHAEAFETASVLAEEVFKDERLHDRTDLRLALDEADDYELIRKVYRNLEDVMDAREIVSYLDANEEVRALNAHLLP